MRVHVGPYDHSPVQRRFNGLFVGGGHSNKGAPRSHSHDENGPFPVSIGYKVTESSVDDKARAELTDNKKLVLLAVAVHRGDNSVVRRARAQNGFGARKSFAPAGVCQSWHGDQGCVSTEGIVEKAFDAVEYRLKAQIEHTTSSKGSTLLT